MMRTAAGRRALQVVLVMGGLLALGFFCGGQAEAADSTGATTTASTATTVSKTTTVSTTTVSRVATAATPERVVESALPSDLPTPRKASTAAVKSPAAKASTIPAAKSPAAPVASVSSKVDQIDQVGKVGKALTGIHVAHAAREVVRPAGDLVGAATVGLTEPSADVLPSMPTLPGLPSAPEMPQLPSLPDWSGLPALPGGGQILPVPAAPQQPGGMAQPERSDETAVEDGAAHQTAVVASPYGPRGRSAEAVGAAVRGGADGLAIPHVPAHPAPGGEPTGVLDSRSAVDSGAPRHGDPHAVTLNHRAPLRLVPGAPAVVTAAETRDRHRDIPVFPG
jgi:hypothetical protein